MEEEKRENNVETTVESSVETAVETTIEPSPDSTVETVPETVPEPSAAASTDSSTEAAASAVQTPDGVPLLEKVRMYAKRGYGIQAAITALLIGYAIIGTMDFVSESVYYQTATLCWCALGFFCGAVALIVALYFIPVRHPEKIFARNIGRTKNMLQRFGKAVPMNTEGEEKPRWIAVLSVPLLLYLFMLSRYTNLFTATKLCHASMIYFLCLNFIVIVGVFILAEINNCKMRTLTRRYMLLYNEEKEVEAYTLYHANRNSSSPREKIWIATLGQTVALGAMLLVWIVGTVLYPFVLSPTFSAYARTVPVGKKITNLEEYLGLPVAQQDETWEYYSFAYKQTYKKLVKSEKDMQKAIEDNDAEAFEKAFQTNMETAEKLLNMTHRVMQVRFSQDQTIVEVTLDTNYRQGVAETKSLKKQDIQGDTTVREDEDISQKVIYVKQYFTDGSFHFYALPAYVLAQLDRTQKGTQTLEWKDVWSTYYITLTVE